MTADLMNRLPAAKTPWLFATLVSVLLLLYPIFGQLMPGESGMLTFTAGFYLVLVWFAGQRGWAKLRVSSAGLFWLIVGVFALTSYVAMTTLSSTTVIVLFMSISVMLGLSISTAWIRPAVRVLLAFVSIHAAATVVFYAIPSLYFGVFKPRFFPDVLMANGYTAGLTQHYSYNAMFCVIGLLIAGATALFSVERGRVQLGYWGLTFFFLFALFLTTKRAHIVMAVAALFMVYLFSNANAKLIKITLAVVVGLAGLLWLASINEGVAEALSRITESFGETDDLREVTSGRTLLWDAALAGWKSSPIIGLGWQSYHFIWPSGVTESFHAHNQVINTLYEGGVIGTVLYVCAAVAAGVIGAWVLRQVQKRSETPPWVRPAAAFGFAMQLFFAMYANSTGELLHTAYAFIPYFFAVAIAIAVRAEFTRQHNTALLQGASSSYALLGSRATSKGID